MAFADREPLLCELVQQTESRGPNKQKFKIFNQNYLFFRSISCQLFCPSTTNTIASFSQKFSQSFLKLALPHSQQPQQQFLKENSQTGNEDPNYLGPNFQISPSSSHSSLASPNLTQKSPNIQSKSPNLKLKSPKLERKSAFDDIATITVHQKMKSK